MESIEVAAFLGYCCQGVVVTGDTTGGNEQLSCVSAQAEPQEEDAGQICLERGTPAF